MIQPIKALTGAEECGMSKELGHVYGGYGDDILEKPKIDRRKFLAGGIGAGVIFIAGGGALKLSRDSKSGQPASSEAYVPADHSISAEQAEINLSTLIENPSLYADRPWADPHQLIGLTRQELMELSSIQINSETRTDEGFALAFTQGIERIMCAGQNLTDVGLAREQGFAVGERDNLGNELGEYENYVYPTYGKHLIDGMFLKTYRDSDFSPVVNNVRLYQEKFANKYEAMIDESTLSGIEELASTVYLTLDSVRSMPTDGFDIDRHLRMILHMRSPSVRLDDAVRDLEVDTYINGSSDNPNKYNVMLGAFRPIEG